MSARPSPPRAAAPARTRRALSHVGGAVHVHTDDPRLAELLRRALSVEGDETSVHKHVHGFHSYPARLHPETAETLIAGLSGSRDTVLDPFCGSGTVPIAAQEQGRRALGSDLNPLAIALARLKTASVDEAFTAALCDAAEQVAEHAKARQKAKLGPTHPYGPEDRGLFETYVLLALDGLRDGIDRIERDDLARALYLVLSAILTKLSQKRGDSSGETREKRIARSFAFRFFVMKARELAERLRDYATLIPAGTARARIEAADARELAFIKARSVQLIVSSPPYPGVYDYYQHHAVRLRWLRMDARPFQRGEIGARRDARSPAAAIQRWSLDFGACLKEVSRVLEPGGRAALVLADSVVANRPYYADEWLPKLAAQQGLRTLAIASQARPHFHEPSQRAFSIKPRQEHVIVLGRPS